MLVEIQINHVNALKNPKVSIDEGTVTYTLPFEVQLPPGDFERIVQLFRQRVPVQLTLTSPQAKMDLFIETFRDTETASYTPEDADELRQQAKDALRTSQIAEQLAAQGDATDREVADAAAATAAEAITKAATALDVSENTLLTTIGAELQQETFEAEEAAVRERDAQAREEESKALAGDPEALQREIAGHASESEAAAEGAAAAAKEREQEKLPTRREKASAK